MTAAKSLTIVAAILAGGTAVAIAQNGPSGGEPPVAGGAGGNPLNGYYGYDIERLAGSGRSADTQMIDATHVKPSRTYFWRLRFPFAETGSHAASDADRHTCDPGHSAGISKMIESAFGRPGLRFVPQPGLAWASAEVEPPAGVLCYGVSVYVGTAFALNSR